MAPSKALGKYTKADILKQLRDTSAAIEMSLKDYATQLTEWKDTTPAKFAIAVAEWPKDRYAHWSDHNWAPPTHKDREACSDWRIQALNKAIARVDSMDGDIISLRADDDLFTYVGLAACL